MFIRSQKKFFQAEALSVGLILLQTRLEAAPSYTDRRVNTNEDEERPAEKLVEYNFIVNICCDPSFSPSPCDKSYQIFCGIESTRGGNQLRFLDDAVELWNNTRRFQISL
jgi:hypothetical protein